jgi:hypothetical protein
MKRLSTLVAALLFTVLATPASAYTIASFALSGVTFADGGTASGTFRIGYDNGPVFSPSIATTAGTILNGAQYQGIAIQINFVADTWIQISTGSSSPDDGFMRLVVHDILNPTTLASLPTFAITFGTERIYPACSIPPCPPSVARNVIAGSIVTTGIEIVPDPGPPAVPLPATLPLFATALIGMGVLGRRRSVRHGENDLATGASRLGQCKRLLELG